MAWGENLTISYSVPEITTFQKSINLSLLEESSVT